MAKLISKDFVSDRPSLILAFIGLTLGIVNSLFVIFRIKQSDFPIPVRLDQYSKSLELGKWYTNYEFVVFAVIVTIFNLLIALRLHANRPRLAKAVMVFHILVMIFLFMVSRAVLSLPSTS